MPAMIMQRKCANSDRSNMKQRRETGLNNIQPIVQEGLQSPGEPLDHATRAYMEPLFGHNFSQVRVHKDVQAAKSARAVNSLAYTVGRDVVFGEGHYEPMTNVGRRLLGHELTHVVQQQFLPANLHSSMTLSRADDTAEREAADVANTVMEGLPAPAIRNFGFGTAIQTAGDRDPGTPSPPAPTPSQPAAGPVCGPDVTAQVTSAVANTRTTFGSWNNSKKERQCDALDSLSTGAYAWDIVELHNNAWILGYRPACATQGATPPCGSTVKVGNDCYYAGSPNYVIYGAMCQLCNAHFTSVGNSSGANRFTENRMLYWINFYKGTGPLGISTPSGNFGPSKDWAVAGYRGWPGAGAPAGDRNNCAPTCPTAYSGGAFNVNWVPHGII